MPKALAQLVAVLLLITQAVATLNPGRVLCLATGEVGACEIAAEAGCDHCDDHDVRLGSALGGEDDRCDVGPHLALLHMDDDCGCHIHVPVKSDDTLPTTPRERNVEAGSIPVPVLVALVLNWNAAAPCAVRPKFEPPDRSRAADAIALKSTRLRV